MARKEQVAVELRNGEHVVATVVTRKGGWTTVETSDGKTITPPRVLLGFSKPCCRPTFSSQPDAGESEDESPRPEKPSIAWILLGVSGACMLAAGMAAPGHAQEYPTQRFICRASSYDALIQDYAAIAQHVGGDDPRVQKIVANKNDRAFHSTLREYVKKWLKESTGYLLIVDNADFKRKLAHATVVGNNGNIDSITLAKALTTLLSWMPAMQRRP